MANRTILRINAVKPKVKKPQEVEAAAPEVTSAPAVEKVEESKPAVVEAAKEEAVEKAASVKEDAKKPRRAKRSSRSKAKVQE
jgi:hypothetical protein